eukprot:Gb_15894 [translate_table: standard]
MLQIPRRSLLLEINYGGRDSRLCCQVDQESKALTEVAVVWEREGCRKNSAKIHEVLTLRTPTYAFSSFNETNREEFLLLNANINLGALQVTPDTGDTRQEFSIANEYGRVLLNKRFRLWKKSSGENVLASFNTSFVINIVPKNGSGGEGLAFIITNAKTLPDNSYGQYLGLFNSSTNGNPKNNLVAVEFDTRKSNGDDPDDNHVGIDVNSIKSIAKISLTDFKINLKNASDIAAWIQYDGERKQMNVYVANGNIITPSNPVLSIPIDLSQYLEDEIYVGFSAATGNQTQLNCIRSWNLKVVDLGSGSTRGTVIGLAVGLSLGFIVVIGVLGVAIIWRRGHKHRKSIRVLERALTDSTGGPRRFRFKDLKSATNNFDKKYMLGQGGFGAVYKGFLSNKSPIAVKRVSENSHQGEQEFIAEVMIISRLRHKNLVRLLGWCHENGELLLVYDLMPNGSLDKLIFEKNTKHEVLDWDNRYKIVSGVASALLYLHEECEQQVIHRDLKASNVMLDSDYNARLGDFGLARLIEHNKNSYTTTAIAGTPGYIAPECFHTGRATTESDVFSFGAVALEVACGRRPRTESEAHLVDWVWRLYREGRLVEAADPRLMGRFDKDEMKCMLALGLACSHPNPQERPTIRQVSQILAKDVPPPFLPLFKPAFVWPAPPSSMSEILSSSSDFSTQ